MRRISRAARVTGLRRPRRSGGAGRVRSSASVSRFRSPIRALDGPLALVEGIADALDQLVDHLAHLAPSVRVGDLAEAAPERGQLTVAPAEVPGPHRVEGGEVRRGGDCLERLRRHAVEVGGHALVRAPRATSTSC